MLFLLLCGIAAGAVLAFLYRLYTLTQSLKVLAMDVEHVSVLLRQYAQSIDTRLIHLHAVIKGRKDTDKVDYF